MEILNELLNELKSINVKHRNFKIKGNGRSIVFGKVNKYGKGVKNNDYFGDSSLNTKYPRIFQILQRIKEYYSFDCTSFQINHNFKCLPHKDKNNIGKSLIIGFGNYTGGNLIVNNESYDINYKPLIFDGCENEHYVDEFQGERYTIILFTCKKIR